MKREEEGRKKEGRMIDDEKGFVLRGGNGDIPFYALSAL